VVFLGDETKQNEESLDMKSADEGVFYRGLLVGNGHTHGQQIKWGSGMQVCESYVSPFGTENADCRNVLISCYTQNWTVYLHGTLENAFKI